MANTKNPKDKVAGGGRGEFSPNDKWFQEARIKSRRVLDGTDRFTFQEMQRIIAELILR